MFAEIKDNVLVEFPYNYDTLLKNNPHTKFSQEDLLSMYAGTDANLSGNKLVRITESTPPIYNTQTQNIFQDAVPKLIDNVWVLGWTINPLNTEEQTAKTTAQAKSVRASRNEKLKECDWTQVIDSPVDQTVWATYRQALRDVTAQEGFPWTITWPTQPE